jgi:hypothetical protein
MKAAAALAALFLVPTAADAGWTLLERREANGRIEYRLRFEPAAAATVAERTSPFTAEVRTALDLPLMPYPVPPPRAAQPRGDALLAIPAGIGTHGWAILPAHEGGDEPPATISPVRVGAVEALRLSAAPDAVPFEAILAAPPRRERQADASSTLGDGWLRGAFLNPEDAHVSRGARGALPAPPAPFAVSHRTEGTIIAVEHAALPTTGSLRLTHHGAVIPLGGTHGTREWFFAPRRKTLTDRTDSVFIEPGAAAPSPAMATRPAFTTLTPAGTEVALTRTRRIDGNLVYERSAVLPVGERFVFHRLNRGQSREHTFAHRDRLTTTTVTATFHLLGYNQTPTITPDHYADLRVGSAGIPQRTSWQGRTPHSFSVTGSTGSLLVPSIPFAHTIPAVDGGPIADQQNLDIVELTWTGLPTLDSGGCITLELPAAPAPRRVTIGGFPSGAAAADIALLDITNPHAPVRIVGAPLFSATPTMRALEVEAPATTTTLFAAYLPSVAATPPRATEALPAPPAHLEGVAVRPLVFADEIAPLLAAKGAGWVAFDPQVAYDIFNGGQESPEAIRDAVATLADAAPSVTALPHILLVGHATFDPRDYMGLQTAPQVPVFIELGVDSGVTIENNTDAPYAFLAGSDDLPDATVGRFPAKTEAEAATMVARALAHAASGAALDIADRPALFVYDDEEAFLLDADSWSSYWSETGRADIRVDVSVASDGSAERAAIRDAFERTPAGVAFALYMGHGSVTVWGDEQVLTNATAAALQTENKWPVVATFTCLNGYFATPGGINRALAETLLITGPHGAAAMIAPGGVDFYQPQRNFAEEVMAQLGVRWDLRADTVGGLLAAAQLQHALDWPGEAHVRREFLIFGDPATPLFLLEPNLTPVRDWSVME